jgi:hypothetical protein
MPEQGQFSRPLQENTIDHQPLLFGLNLRSAFMGSQRQAIALRRSLYHK